MKAKTVLFIVVILSLFVIAPNSALSQPQCPGDQIINGSLDAANGPFQTSRILANGVSSQCNPPKPFPGTFGAVQQNFRVHEFGFAAGDSCVTVNYDPGTCGLDASVAAYMNSYDPLNFPQNYLGDLGFFPTNPDSFDFVIPTGNRLLVVVYSTFGPVTCDYSFNIENFACIPEGLDIALTPLTATNPILTVHTVTAVVETEGVPDEGVLVSFEVISGPNAGEVSDPDSGECTPNDDCTTDASGQVLWTYTGGTETGTDTIVAFAGTLESEPVEKTWIIIRNVPTLSVWGLIAMAGALGIIGLIAVRKRKVSA